MNITELLKKAYNYGEMHQSLLKDKYSLTNFLEEHKEAINFMQCSTQLNAGFKVGDKVVSINGRVAEIIGFPKHGHARVRNDVGGGIWQPNIAELKLHKSV